MGSMKRLVLLFCCSAAMLCAADLASVHTVYLLKMAKGLDQFLANRLTSDHVFQIVTDPKLADAVFTDQIGEGFQAKLEEMFPPSQKQARRGHPSTAKFFLANLREASPPRLVRSQRSHHHESAAGGGGHAHSESG